MSTQLLLVGKLFLLMSIGFFLRKRNIIPDAGKQMLTDLVIDLILPCSIICSFLMELTMERLSQAGVIFLLSLGIQVACFFASQFLYRGAEKGHLSVLQYGTLCSNAGFLGTPIAEGIFGAEGTLLAAIFLIPQRVAMWTLGLSYYTKKNGKFSLKKIVTHPCIAAVFIGMILMLTQLPLPSLLTDTLRAVGNCNTAMSMLLVGSIVADMSPQLLHHRDTLYYAVIRLIVLPLLVLLACRLCGIPALVRNVAVVLTAMPAGGTTSILALKYNGDAPFASACIALTTFLSLLALPVWCAILL